MVSLKGLVENLDIKTNVVTVSTLAVKLADIVPPGMKRWITFVKLNNKDKGKNMILLCSSLSSNTASSSISKDKIILSSPYDIVSYPENPSPLFSVSSSAFLTSITDKGEVDVFIQYFDN